MKEEGSKKEEPKTVARPAVPADYLKARPRVYLNRFSRKPAPRSVPPPSDAYQNPPEPSVSVNQPQAVSLSVSLPKLSPRAQKKAEKAAKKAERLKTEKLLRSDTMLGEPDISSHPDIEHIWKEQEAIRLADEKLEQEYQAAKERSKQLKKRIKKHNLDGDNLNLKGILGPDGYEKAVTTGQKAKIILKKTSKKLEPVVQKAATAAVKPIKQRHKLKLLPQIVPQLRKYKKPLAMATASVIVLAGGIFVAVKSKGTKSNTAGQTTQVAGQAIVKPDFDIVTQANTPSDKVHFDPQRRVASFEVMVGERTVTVSQQQLPEAFKSDTAGQLEQFAKDAYATKPLTYAGGTAYQGQSIKGPQTVIMTKNGLLIFLTSTDKIADELWVELLNTLQ